MPVRWSLRFFGVWLAILLALELLVQSGARSSLFLPAPSAVARNFGADRRQMFLHVLLPGSMPLMLTGLRLSANVAFHSTIGVEMVGSRTGMGAMLWLSWQTFRIDHLYAILVVIATIGIGLATLIRWVAQRSAPWMAD